MDSSAYCAYSDCPDHFSRVSSETGPYGRRNLGGVPRAYAHLHRQAIAEDPTVKMYRVVFLLAALLIAGLVTWTIARQPVGAKEVQAIEAAQ
jgi:hypothetical protein